MSAAFVPCSDVRSEAWTEKSKLHVVQCFIFSHVVTVRLSMEVSENFPLQWIWHNDEVCLLGISQNWFEENYFFLDDLYSALLKGCFVASMNCGEVRCGPFNLSWLNMEEDRIGIGVDLIRTRPVEDVSLFF